MSEPRKKTPKSKKGPRKLVANGKIPGLYIPAAKPRRARRREAEKAKLMRKKETLSKENNKSDQELQQARVRKGSIVANILDIKNPAYKRH